MRHGKRRTRLSRQPTHRKHTVKIIAKHLILHQRIKTTLIKAKEARRFAEKLITLAKQDTVHARQRVYSHLNDRDFVKYLFREIAPLFKNRNSGFTRIIPIGFRRGDGADVVFLELTERKTEEEKPKKVKKLAAEKTQPPKEKPRPVAKAAPAVEPAKKEERAVEEIKKEKAKEEERRIERSKNFFKDLKGFFRRRTKM